MHEKVYDREKSVAYAHRWAFSANPKYYDFSSLGGDCTNFASQAVFAGCSVMNYDMIGGWFYSNTNSRSHSWSSVELFYSFLTKNSGVGPYGSRCEMALMLAGDIVQLSFNGSFFQHSPVIVSVGQIPSPENILVATHSLDSDNRPLSTYNYAKIRFIHITGAREW